MAEYNKWTIARDKTPIEEAEYQRDLRAVDSTPTQTTNDDFVSDKPIADRDKALGEMDRQAQEGVKNIGALEGGDVSYQGPDSQELIDDSALKQGQSYVTPESTVSGQLESLIDSDSQYMQIAQKKAQEQAASMGLLGSSAAVGATHRAAIESALPIAQQDAKTYAQAQLEQQKTENQMSKDWQESQLTAAGREHIYNIDNEKAKLSASIDLMSDAAKSSIDLTGQGALKQMEAQWNAEVNTSMKRLDTKLAMMQEDQKITADQRKQAQTLSTQVMTATYGTINELLQNADFMAGFEGDPAGLQKVFNNFINMGKNQVEFIGATAGLGTEYYAPNGYAGLIGGWTTDLASYKPPA